MTQLACDMYVQGQLHFFFNDKKGYIEGMSLEGKTMSSIPAQEISFLSVICTYVQFPYNLPRLGSPLISDHLCYCIGIHTHKHTHTHMYRCELLPFT